MGYASVIERNKLPLSESQDERALHEKDVFIFPFI